MLNTMEALGEDVFGENDQMFDKSRKNFSSSLLEVQRTHMHVENSSKLISMDITTIQFLFYMHLKTQQWSFFSHWHNINEHDKKQTPKKKGGVRRFWLFWFEF